MFETALAVACVSSASLCLCRRLRSSRVRCAGRPGIHHSTHPSTNPTPATLATVYPLLSALNVPSDSTSHAVPRRLSPSLRALVPCRLPPLTFCLLALLVLLLLPSMLLYFSTSTFFPLTSTSHHHHHTTHHTTHTTTILHTLHTDRLQVDEPITTIPTIGFNVETLQYKNIKFQVWDLGGQTSIRPYWRCYYPNTDAIIYVVDR